MKELTKIALKMEELSKFLNSQILLKLTAMDSKQLLLNNRYPLPSMQVLLGNSTLEEFYLNGLVEKI